MVLCKFWQTSSCRKGAACRFDHPNGKDSSRDGGFVNNNNNNRGGFGSGTFGNSNRTSGWGINRDDISADLITSRPKWILSSYGPVKETPASLFPDNEFSPEEVRWRFYQAQATGNADEADREAITLWQKADTSMREAAPKVTDMQAYMDAKDKEHPNRFDFSDKSKFTGSITVEQFIKNYAVTSGTNSPFGNNGSNGTTNGFGNNTTSNPFSRPAFGQPAQSTFGQASQPSAFTKSAFGQPAASAGFGQSAVPASFGKPAFGQPAATSGFGQTAAPAAFGQPAQPSAFGQPAQPSAFGQAAQPSAFGKPAWGQTAAAPAFGQAAQPSAFGQPAQPSAFGQAAQPSAFGKPAFGQPASGTSFGQNAGPLAFGQPAQPATFGQPTAPAATAFGQASNIGQNTNPFAKPTASAGFGAGTGIGAGTGFGGGFVPSSSSPFGQAGNNSGNASPFSQTGATAGSSAFGAPTTSADSMKAEAPFGQTNAAPGGTGFGSNPETNSSPFGKVVGFGSTPAFGAPSQQGGGLGPNPFAKVNTTATGQPIPPQQQSGFGQPQFGSNPFNQVTGPQSQPGGALFAARGLEQQSPAQQLTSVASNVSKATTAISSSGKPGNKSVPLAYSQTLPNQPPVMDKNRVTRYRGFPVEFDVKKKPTAEGTEVIDVVIPVFRRPDGKGTQRVWHPLASDDPQVVKLGAVLHDIQVDDKEYTDHVKQQYATLFETGRFGAGIPLVPPLHSWVDYDF